MQNPFPSHLTNRELLAEVLRLARSERDATVKLVAHLAELNRRKLYRQANVPSPYLSAANQGELIAAAGGKSKRQVEELLARLFPKPDVPSSVQVFRAPTPPPTTATAPPGGVPGLQPLARGTAGPSPVSPPAAPTAAYRPPVTPLAPERYQITFTAGAETRANLQFAQDLLRHALPTGDVAAIMDRALKALIDDLVKKKFAIGRKPRKSRGPAPDSRAIPAWVKRVVYIRDRGCCAFVGTDGVRCRERAFVEFHHHGRPWAAGGESTPQNVQLRCRSHNQQEADRYFGPREPDTVCEAGVPYGQPIVNKTGPGTGWVAGQGGIESARHYRRTGCVLPDNWWPSGSCVSPARAPGRPNRPPPRCG